jgi:UDP-N-acetylglucosamine/UDP-N-acetylgalactosamine diphosphorylase
MGADRILKENGGGHRTKMSDIAALRARFAEYGQEHVFRWWRELDPTSRIRLENQAAGIDLAALARIHAAQATSTDGSQPQLAPVDVERLEDPRRSPETTASARQCGEDLLASGRAAALVVAGGQGSRLGFEGPKGAFPIGPVSDRTLFEIQAQKLLGLRQRFGRALPWCVMTSAATDATTRDFFRSHAFFGLPEEDVFFFSQGGVPSLDFAGRMFLERRDRIFENPDGHGGCLTGLHRSGVLDALEDRGIDTVFYYQVDNPLVRMCDPLYLGLHESAGAEISCKVVRKTDPEEKVGIVARANGRVSVVEYTELGEEDRYARDPEGELVYWTGNIAIHLFATAFIRRVARDADGLLPFHASEKKIPHLDDAGRPVTPSEPNGRKFERFVFDALAAATRVCIVEADRAVEFSPVKNAKGDDSPETARRDLAATYRRWLSEAGIALPEGSAVEIDHSQIDATEDVRRLGIRTVADAGDAIRVASGEPV